MSQPIDREGTFRGRITSYGVYEPGKDGSKSVAIGITVAIDEMFDRETEEWQDWREYQLEAEGNVWIIKKDGSINQKTAEKFMATTGWNGDLASVANGTFEPRPCGISVERDEYRNEVRFRIAWVNDYDSTPGGGGFADAERTKQLQSQFGNQLRAIAGNVKRNAPKPAGKPADPPKPAATEPAAEPPAEPAAEPVPEPVPGDDIPF